MRERQSRRKPSGAKPWRARVRRRQRVKCDQRRGWETGAWAEHLNRRCDMQERIPGRPLKFVRLGRDAAAADRKARSDRMRAYHARRRAALAAARDD